MNKSKLVKLLTKSFKKTIKKNSLLTLDSGIETPLYQEMLFSENDPEISKNFRKLISKLLVLRDELSIYFSEHRITIGSEESLMSSKKNTRQYFSIEIIKDIGFLVSQDKKRLAFKDPLIFRDVVNEMRTTFTKLNTENFGDFYQSILVEYGLSRETNLENLLD